MEQQISLEKKQQELEALKERVKEGNRKLNEAWGKICDMCLKKEQWERETDKWHEASHKLNNLCFELQLKGYRDCLYIENGVKMRTCLSQEGFGCRVCPSDKNYWETELMSLSSPSKKA